MTTIVELGLVPCENSIDIPQSSRLLVIGWTQWECHKIRLLNTNLIYSYTLQRTPCCGLVFAIYSPLAHLTSS